MLSIASLSISISASSAHDHTSSSSSQSSASASSGPGRFGVVPGSHPNLNDVETSNDSSNRPSANVTATGIPAGAIRLGIPPLPLKKGGGIWNIDGTQDTEAKLAKVGNNELEITYPAKCGAPKNHKCGSHAGMNFHASPRGAFPAETVTMGYEVFFPKDFDFKNSGKLPGMWMGAPGASGGDWKSNGGSARIMWRLKDGQKTPELVAYLYIPTEVAGGNQEAAVKKQRIKSAHQSGSSDHTTGIDVFGHDTKTAAAGTLLKPKVGDWNTIVYTVKLNSIGKTDGSISLSLNGVTRTQNNMTWRKSKLMINGLMMSSWFGGSDIKKFGNTQDEKARFRNFWVKKN